MQKGDHYNNINDNIKPCPHPFSIVQSIACTQIPQRYIWSLGQICHLYCCTAAKLIPQTFTWNPWCFWPQPQSSPRLLSQKPETSQMEASGPPVCPVSLVSVPLSMAFSHIVEAVLFSPFCSALRRRAGDGRGSDLPELLAPCFSRAVLPFSWTRGAWMLVRWQLVHLPPEVG